MLTSHLSLLQIKQTRDLKILLSIRRHPEPMHGSLAAKAWLLRLLIGAHILRIPLTFGEDLKSITLHTPAVSPETRLISNTSSKVQNIYLKKPRCNRRILPMRFFICPMAISL